MPLPKKTFFNACWALEKDFKNIIAADPKDRGYALCLVCKGRNGQPKPIYLSNMGRRALTSHIAGKEHQIKIKAQCGSFGIGLFLHRQAKDSQPPTTENPQSDAVASVSARIVDSDPGRITVTESEVATCSVQLSRPTTSVQPPNSTTSQPSRPTTSVQPPNSTTSPFSSNQLRGVQQYILRDEVTKAEIWWCLFSVECHLSLRSAGVASRIFPKMFCDSQIAQKFQLGRTKLGYNIVYGLGPYFHELILKEVNACDCFVVFFDESLNKCSQQQQMDIAVRFWGNSGNEVVTRYFSSSFLGHSTSRDLLKGLVDVIKPLSLHKVIQVSMDGPNVNLKMVRDLQAYLRGILDEDNPMFMYMGTCGLHVISNSFKTGFSDKSTKWYVISYLRAVYNFFKDVPARRSDLVRYSGSNILPIKFCPVRWLSNAAVATRGKELLPNLAKFKAGIECDPSHPTVNSYTYGIIKDALKDKLMPCKLSFFSAISSELEPFLTQFQSDAPMAPFLYTELKNVLVTLLDMIIKEEILAKESSVWKIDLQDSNSFKAAQNFKFVLSVKTELAKVKLTKEEIQAFKVECMRIVKAICIKILEKSPLKYKLCKGITFCDPCLLAENKKICLSRLELALTVFIENKWVAGSEGDAIIKEFRTLIANPDVMSSCKAYGKDERLDHFWRGLTAAHKSSDVLWNFLKKIMILSQGNAFVERGFSVNKEIIIENQKNESLIAQRQVYDGVKSMGGILKMEEIPKSMIHKVRNSRCMYSEALQKNKEAKELMDMEDLQKKRLAEEIDELKKKKIMIIAEKQKELDIVNERMEALCGGSVKV